MHPLLLNSRSLCSKHADHIFDFTKFSDDDLIKLISKSSRFRLYALNEIFKRDSTFIKEYQSEFLRNALLNVVKTDKLGDDVEISKLDVWPFFESLKSKENVNTALLALSAAFCLINNVDLSINKQQQLNKMILLLGLDQNATRDVVLAAIALNRENINLARLVESWLPTLLESKKEMHGNWLVDKRENLRKTRLTILASIIMCLPEALRHKIVDVLLQPLKASVSNVDQSFAFIFDKSLERTLKALEIILPSLKDESTLLQEQAVETVIGYLPETDSALKSEIFKLFAKMAPYLSPTLQNKICMAIESNKIENDDNYSNKIQIRASAALSHYGTLDTRNKFIRNCWKKIQDKNEDICLMGMNGLMAFPEDFELFNEEERERLIEESWIPLLSSDDYSIGIAACESLQMFIPFMPLSYREDRLALLLPYLSETLVKPPRVTSWGIEGDYAIAICNMIKNIALTLSQARREEVVIPYFSKLLGGNYINKTIIHCLSDLVGASTSSQLNPAKETFLEAFSAGNFSEIEQACGFLDAIDVENLPREKIDSIAAQIVDLIENDTYQSIYSLNNVLKKFQGHFSEDMIEKISSLMLPCLDIETVTHKGDNPDGEIDLLMMISPAVSQEKLQVIMEKIALLNSDDKGDVNWKEIIKFSLSSEGYADTVINAFSQCEKPIPHFAFIYDLMKDADVGMQMHKRHKIA